MKKGKILLVVVILVLVIACLLFFLLIYPRINGGAGNGNTGKECSQDSDCIPATCCHPSTCTSRGNAPDCSGMFCSDVCLPGSLDCGQGKCVCLEGKCGAKTN